MILAWPSAGRAQEATLARRGRRFDGRRAARGERGGGARGDGQPLRVGHRWKRCVPAARAYGQLSDHRPTAWIHDHHAHRRAAAGGAADCPEPRDVAVNGAGIGDRHRGSAAHRYDDLERRWQHRSTADAGPAGAGAQLDGPDAPGPGQPGQRRQRVAGDDGRQFQHPRRWPGGDDEDHRHQWPAGLQPRCHRRVRDHHHALQRRAGPLERRHDQRDHEIGHQPARRHLLGLLPERWLQRGRSGGG